MSHRISMDDIISMTGIQIKPSMLITLINNIGEVNVRVNSDMLELFNAFVTVNNNSFINSHRIITKILLGDYINELGEIKFEDKYLEASTFIDEYLTPMIESILEVINKKYSNIPIKMYANRNYEYVEYDPFDNHLHVIIGVDNEYLVNNIDKFSETIYSLKNILSELFSTKIDKLEYINDVHLFTEQ